MARYASVVLVNYEMMMCRRWLQMARFNSTNFAMGSHYLHIVSLCLPLSPSAKCAAAVLIFIECGTCWTCLW